MSSGAKVPNDATDWRAIDIFVFTNGQRYSPPRKYHLNALELNWWKAMLSFLARSQYGSLHSTVDLYTVDGEKLEGPLQLTNGAAYVVVKPPDKCWEKSRTRRSNSIEIKNTDDCNVTTLSNTDTCNKRFKEEVQVYKTTLPGTKVIEKPQTLLNIHDYPQKDSNAIPKPTDKRHSQMQRASILRKSGTTPTTRKDFEKCKEVVRNFKGHLKLNDKAPVDNRGTATKLKITQKTDEQNSSVKPEQVDLPELETPLVSNYSNANMSLVDKTDNVCSHEKDDSFLVANIFKSTDSEIPSILVKLSGSHIGHEITNKILNDIIDEFISNETKFTPDIVNNVQKSSLIENISSTSSVKNNLCKQILNVQGTPNLSFADNSDKNYILINNGDRVNLKLQIEVRGGGGPLKKSDKNEPKVYSTNLEKTEKESQINLDSEVIQNKSLQSIFMSEFVENVGVHGNSGSVVIKCTCGKENKFNISKIYTDTSRNDNKMYVILLPPLGDDNNIHRCLCDNKIIDMINTNAQQTNKSSIINPVKRTTSSMALEILARPTNVSNDTYPRLQNLKCDKNASVSKVAKYQKKESVVIAINENESINHTDTDNVSKLDGNDNVYCKLFMNDTNMLVNRKEISVKATQTALCSLLLEARSHEDGRYSFHLPPLQILRYYNI